MRIAQWCRNFLKYVHRSLEWAKIGDLQLLMQCCENMEFEVVHKNFQIRNLKNNVVQGVVTPCERNWITAINECPTMELISGEPVDVMRSVVSTDRRSVLCGWNGGRFQWLVIGMRRNVIQTGSNWEWQRSIFDDVEYNKNAIGKKWTSWAT